MADRRSLTRLRRLGARRESASEAWRQAVLDAIADGHSQRVVGEAAGVSHTRVQQILRGK